MPKMFRPNEMRMTAAISAEVRHRSFMTAQTASGQMR